MLVNMYCICSLSSNLNLHFLANNFHRSFREALAFVKHEFFYQAPPEELFHPQPECMDWPTRSPSPCRQCTICGAPSNGYHFNAPSCSACAAFFRRTVTLGRQFVCAQHGCCKVHFEMRVICRACRYSKCIQMGMDRHAVQPRRDCNVGRRKISYSKRSSSMSKQASLDKLASAMETSGLSPEMHYAASYSSSISEDPDVSPHSFCQTQETPETVLEMLMREERLYNERRSILYCVKSSISEILSAGDVNDIPFSSEDLTELTFAGVRKDIRAQILATYEWIRGWNHFKCLSTSDKKVLLRRCTLFHPIIDPCYLTMRLGLPDRFVMFNGMFAGIAEDSAEGWRDETCISASLKNRFYRPLLERVLADIVQPMKAINITFVEYVILKALVTFKSASTSNISPALKKCLLSQIDLIFGALSLHYSNMGMPPDEVAERTGNVVLLISNIFEVGMQCLESHQVIQFFDLWKLDDLLIKLISEPATQP